MEKYCVTENHHPDNNSKFFKLSGSDEQSNMILLNLLANAYQLITSNGLWLGSLVGASSLIHTYCTVTVSSAF